MFVMGWCGVWRESRGWRIDDCSFSLRKRETDYYFACLSRGGLGLIWWGSTWEIGRSLRKSGEDVDRGMIFLMLCGRGKETSLIWRSSSWITNGWIYLSRSMKVLDLSSRHTPLVHNKAPKIISCQLATPLYIDFSFSLVLSSPSTNSHSRSV